MQNFNILLIIFVLVVIFFSIVCIFFAKKIVNIKQKFENLMQEFKNSLEEKIDNFEKKIDFRENSLSKSISDSTATFENHQNTLLKFQSDKLNLINQSLEKNLSTNKDFLGESLGNFNNRLQSFSLETEQKLDNMRKTIENSLDKISQNSSEKLDKMKQIVDEKLQKTLEERLSESFKHVNIRLQEVYKGLGDMQNLARGVGDLKKILGNVKTRGIVGEVQLGAILEEILTKNQYEKNVITKQNTQNFVEYAVKMPASENEFVYLPIDSKFPAELYANLCDAYDSADAELIKIHAKALVDSLKFEAKEIREKYIDVPRTTDFAIMFLPFEGLYCEAVNRGMVEFLQRKFHVNIAGPSTMAAFLNSLQMGFRTVAIQKRSAEVWRILSSVKTEFEKFFDALSKTKLKLTQANTALDEVMGVRMRQVQRTLRNIDEESDYEKNENSMSTHESL